MKKSTIILIVFIAVMFFIQFSMIFQVKFKINDLINKIEAELIQQELSLDFQTLVLKASVPVKIQQDSGNWLLTNDSLFTCKVENKQLCLFNNHDYNYEDNIPNIRLNINDLDSIILKDNAYLKSYDMMHFDTLTIVTESSSRIKFEDIRVGYLQIRTHEASYIKIDNLQCQDLEIIASDNARVKINGDIQNAFGELNDNASVRLPSGINLNVKQNDNASLKLKN